MAISVENRKFFTLHVYFVPPPLTGFPLELVPALGDKKLNDGGYWAEKEV